LTLAPTSLLTDRALILVVIVHTTTTSFLLPLATASDNDSVDATASSLPLVIFGGQGNDTIKGGTGGDVIFGDRGRVIDFGSPTVPALAGTETSEAELSALEAAGAIVL